MVLLDAARRQVEVNGAYLRLLGRTRPELIGVPVYEFVRGGPIHTPHEWQEFMAQTRFTGVADLVRGDGGFVRVEFAGHPSLVGAETVVLFVIITATRGARRPRTHSLDEPLVSGAQLTPRELEVVRLTGIGLTGPEIAEELHVTHNTVRGHIRNAMTKLGARSRAQLVAQTLAEGLWGLEH
jgi:DNA-binding CsgD family transcriptional regulator